jgi:hypothetical protein
LCLYAYQISHSHSLPFVRSYHSKLKNLFFLPLPKGDSSLLGSKKTTSSSRFRISFFRFLFLGELGTCTQNLMPTQGVEPWENHQFPQGGMLKFIYKGRFLAIKIAYEKILGLKIQMVEIYSRASSTCANFYFWKKTKILIFGGISKFHLWANFGKFWAVLGRIYYIGSGWLHAQTLAEIFKSS